MVSMDISSIIYSRTPISPTNREHFCRKAALLEIGDRRQETGGKRKKEGVKRSVFTLMRCSPLTGHRG